MVQKIVEEGVRGRGGGCKSGGRVDIPGMTIVWQPIMKIICIGPNWVMPSCLR